MAGRSGRASAGSHGDPGGDCADQDCPDQDCADHDGPSTQANRDDAHWRDLGAFIRDQRTATQLSIRKLAELAQVSNPYLSQIERGIKRPSAEILRQLAHALEVSAESLFVRAGLLERDPQRNDLIEAIHSQDDLSLDQKQVLIRVYQSFAAEADA